MKINLDTLRNEIEDYLKASGFVVFYGFARTDDAPEIDWDTTNHPDYKEFLNVAKELDVRLIVLHRRQFNGAIIDGAVEELQSSSLEYEDQRSIESRLRELGMYDGFTCAVELSFDYQGSMYLFELRTEWYDELNDLLDQLEISIDSNDSGDDQTYGGYYSKN